jgi:hypothetical protein
MFNEDVLCCVGRYPIAAFAPWQGVWQGERTARPGSSSRRGRQDAPPHARYEGVFRIHAGSINGAVFHWGHSHWWTNEYRARYHVASTDAGWRIVADEMLEEKRVDAGPLPANAGPRPAGGSVEVQDF